MNPLTKSRFTVYVTVRALMAAIPGLLLVFFLGGWITTTIFGAGVILSAVVAAQLVYGAVRKRIRANRNPWLPCLCAVLILYVVYGILIAVVSVPQAAQSPLGWHSISGFFILAIVVSAFSLVVSAVLALPLALELAFRLHRANTTYTDCF